MKLTPGAVVKGGTSLGYKTGDWRDQRPIIDYEKCKVCGMCADVCPDTAIFLHDEQYVIDYEYCKGCGLCATECPADAVEIVPEEK